MIQLSSITIDGEDAFEFLQGQLSNDLSLLDKQAEILAAWCNPKGRVIWFGPVRRSDNGYVLQAPSEMADEIVNRLTVFRFRAKVDFSISDVTVRVDPAEKIALGYPLIGKPQSEAFTPHMLNLDLLGAVSLDKGCYTGQEIVARTHYKGATKRRTQRFACPETVSVGAKLMLADRSIGEVINSSGKEFLAVVSVAKYTSDVCVDGSPIERLPLPYLD